MLRYMDLVEPIARRLAFGLPPSVDLDDLMQEGMLGLLQAAETYDPQRGAAARSWAFAKISFAIRDAIRDNLKTEFLPLWASAVPQVPAEPDRPAAARDDLAEILAAEMAGLTPLERAIVQAIYEENETLHSLRKSRLLGIGWRVLRRSHDTALEKLRPLFDKAA